MNEHARLLIAYLNEVCRFRERGEKAPSWASWRGARMALVPLALGLAVGSCGGNSFGEGTECEGDTCDSLCADKVDNDGDGKADCADDDCAAVCGTGELYGVPKSEDCMNGVDDNSDGLVDCADSECAATELCGVSAEYAAPLEAVCDDQVDNDGNGMTDCDDPNCADLPPCAGNGERYGVPTEDCSNGVDDNFDELVDCADPLCECSVPVYAVPMAPSVPSS